MEEARLTAEEVQRLIADARKPLTPAEQEEYLHNLHTSKLGKRILQLRAELEAAKRDWLSARVEKLLPADKKHWLSDNSKWHLLCQWLQEQGYNVQENGFEAVLLRNGKVLHTFRAYVTTEK